jgi:hypothetical protein
MTLLKLPTLWQLVCIGCLGLASSLPATESPHAKLPTYFQNHCLGCHGKEGESGLNLLELKTDLQDDQSFRAWVRIYDRIEAGEMWFSCLLTAIAVAC